MLLLKTQVAVEPSLYSTLPKLPIGINVVLLVLLCIGIDPAEPPKILVPTCIPLSYILPPTYKSPPIPTPPVTVNAPVFVEEAAVEVVI